MMHSIKSLAIICIFAVSTTLSAQNDTFGKWSLSAGVGLVPTFLADGATVNTLPLSFRLNYQLNPSFSVAAYYGYASSTSSTPILVSDGQQSLVSNQMSVYGLRGEWKRSISRHFDVYGGALIGYNHSSRREFDLATGETIVRPTNTATPYLPGAKQGGIAYSGFVGATYFPHKNIGIYAEAGFGISLLNTGLTLRF